MSPVTSFLHDSMHQATL